MDLVQIREALAEAIKDSIGQTVNVYPYMPHDPAFPCVVITAADDYVLPTESFEPAVSINYDLLTGDTSRPEDAQRFLDELVPQLITAIEGNRGGEMSALGGLVQELSVGPVSLLSPGDSNASLFVASMRVTAMTTR